MKTHKTTKRKNNITRKLLATPEVPCFKCIYAVRLAKNFKLIKCTHTSPNAVINIKDKLELLDSFNPANIISCEGKERRTLEDRRKKK